MMKTPNTASNEITNAVPAQGGRAGDWQYWTPYAAVVWSLIYGLLGIYWAAGGGGFPFTPENVSGGMGPLVGQLETGVAWSVVILAGIPAAALGAAMLRGVRRFRAVFIILGAVLAGVLLLMMTGLDLLVTLGYVPYIIRSLLIGNELAQGYLRGLTQWTLIHQVVCLLGGFLWLAATVSYARRSGDACLYCGRRDGPEGWQSPDKARHWGRVALYVSLVAPIFYAITRYAWVLGVPLGMTKEYLQRGQETGMWTSGLFLATFGLVGATISLGLVQRWGEVFPRWMIGLAGRRVPIALAVVPAAFVSVVLVVGGIVIGSNLPQMVAAVEAAGAKGAQIFWEIFFQVGPTLLFPVWGVALAVATLGYYFRRRGACSICGRGG